MDIKSKNIFIPRKTITRISDEEGLYVERLEFEMYARMQLCLYIIQKNQFESDDYKKFFNEYKEYFTLFSLAKTEIWNKYLRDLIPGETTWYLDYTTNEVYIYA